MIDAEAVIYNEIATAVLAKYPKAYISSDLTIVPAQFPAVSLSEEDNSTYTRSQDSGSGENHANIFWVLEVYSNKKTGKKSECREITAFIDNLLLRMNFTRTMLQPIPNANDATIYRMVGRYRAVIGKDHTLYRR
jgi:hypothetical protein